MAAPGRNYLLTTVSFICGRAVVHVLAVGAEEKSIETDSEGWKQEGELVRGSNYPVPRGVLSALQASFLDIRHCTVAQPRLTQGWLALARRIQPVRRLGVRRIHSMRRLAKDSRAVYLEKTI